MRDVLALKVRSRGGDLIALGEVARLVPAPAQPPINAVACPRSITVQALPKDGVMQQA